MEKHYRSKIPFIQCTGRQWGILTAQRPTQEYFFSSECRFHWQHPQRDHPDEWSDHSLGIYPLLHHLCTSLFKCNPWRPRQHCVKSSALASHQQRTSKMLVFSKSSQNYHSLAEKLYMSMYMLLNLRYKQTFPKSRALSGTKLACGCLPTATASNQVPQKRFNLNDFTVEMSKLDWSSLADDRHTEVFSTTGCPPRGSKQCIGCTGLIDKTLIIRGNF